MTVPVRKDPTGASTIRQRGWELAHWAVANSSTLHIQRVSYAGREWTAGERNGEWRAAVAKGGSTTTQSMRRGPHRHRAVVRGLTCTGDARRGALLLRAGFRVLTPESAGPLENKGP